VFSIAAALKVEHYEIVAYKDLVKLAQHSKKEIAKLDRTYFRD
jgi:ferritin-like metal-binding protein YciE